MAKENHVTDWSGAKILDREGRRRTRQLKESIHIRKEANCMNRDAGAYNLPTTYDRILVTRSSSTLRDHYAWWSSPLTHETSQLDTYILCLVVLYEYDYHTHSCCRVHLQASHLTSTSSAEWSLCRSSSSFICQHIMMMMWCTVCHLSLMNILQHHHEFVKCLRRF